MEQVEDVEPLTMPLPDRTVGIQPFAWGLQGLDLSLLSFCLGLSFLASQGSTQPVLLLLHWVSFSCCLPCGWEVTGRDVLSVCSRAGLCWKLWLQIQNLLIFQCQPVIFSPPGLPHKAVPR